MSIFDTEVSVANRHAVAVLDALRLVCETVEQERQTINPLDGSIALSESCLEMTGRVSGLALSCLSRQA